MALSCPWAGRPACRSHSHASTNTNMPPHEGTTHGHAHACAEHTVSGRHLSLVETWVPREPPGATSGCVTPWRHVALCCAVVRPAGWGARGLPPPPGTCTPRPWATPTLPSFWSAPWLPRGPAGQVRPRYWPPSDAARCRPASAGRCCPRVSSLAAVCMVAPAWPPPAWRVPVCLPRVDPAGGCLLGGLLTCCQLLSQTRFWLGGATPDDDCLPTHAPALPSTPSMLSLPPNTTPYIPHPDGTAILAVQELTLWH